MKVAITVSGQTRSYNRDAKDHLDVFMDMMGNHGWEFDLYGIVWDDCEMPVDAEKFKVLETRSQDELREYIRENYSALSSPIATRADDSQIKDEWIEYIDSLPNNMEREIEWSRRRLAQVWGAFEAIDLIEDPKEYDLVIRWRWDLGFYAKGVDNIMMRDEGNNGIILDHYVDQFLEVIEESQEDMESRPVALFPGYAKSNSVVSSDVLYLEDQFIVMNVHLVEAIQFVDNLELLKFHWYNLLHRNRLGEHTLWTKIFYSLGRYMTETHPPKNMWADIMLVADLPRFLSYQP